MAGALLMIVGGIRAFLKAEVEHPFIDWIEKKTPALQELFVDWEHLKRFQETHESLQDLYSQVYLVGIKETRRQIDEARQQGREGEAWELERKMYDYAEEHSKRSKEAADQHLKGIREVIAKARRMRIILYGALFTIGGIALLTVGLFQMVSQWQMAHGRGRAGTPVG